MAAYKTKQIHVDIQHSDSSSKEDFQDSNDDDLNSQPMENDEENVADDNDGSHIGHDKKGLADVFAKILNTKVPLNKRVILSKGKTDREIRKRKLEKESEVKPDTEVVKAEHFPNVALAKDEKSKLWENMCRTKPDPLDRHRERQLQIIATRGVVHLFNAVRKQQHLVDKETKQPGMSERKKDKVMESITKEKFLAILKGSSNSEAKKEEQKIKQDDVIPVKKSARSHDDSKDKKWSILRDDYMLDAKMKDWDKESSGDSDVD